MKKSLTDWPIGIKKTKQREHILFILENSDKPLGATEIFSQIADDGDSAWLSTVYRTLDLFVKHGIINKINVMNSEIAIYELNRLKHKHYAVCLNCHKIISMNNCPMTEFDPKLEESDFQIMGHNLEIYGLCKDCTSKK